MVPGDPIMSGTAAGIRTGNSLPLSAIPVGTALHNVEMHPGKGGQLARSAGTSARLVSKGVLLCPGSLQLIALCNLCQAASDVGLASQSIRQTATSHHPYSIICANTLTCAYFSAATLLFLVLVTVQMVLLAHCSCHSHLPACRYTVYCCVFV